MWSGTASIFWTLWYSGGWICDFWTPLSFAGVVFLPLYQAVLTLSLYSCSSDPLCGYLHLFPHFINQDMGLSVRKETGWRLYHIRDSAPFVLLSWPCLNKTVLFDNQAVVDRGTGRAARIGRPCAGKTGTSDGHRDVWFAGFTPMLSCVVRILWPSY